MTELLINRAEQNSIACLLLAHGAGAPMDSDYMNGLTACLNKQGIAVARFEFPYMQRRRTEGKKFPPNGIKQLESSFREAFRQLAERADKNLPLLIGGKSMGGRVASMVADEWFADDLPVAGVCCFGYPFHAPGKPENLRIEHLLTQKTPTLILQGTRDPFGKPETIKPLSLSKNVEIIWLESGEHDMKPLAKSGLTQQGLWQQAAAVVNSFVKKLGG